MKSVQLSLYHHDQLVQSRTLAQSVIKIGRLPSADVRLEDESIARMHAVIEVSDADLRVVDLGSTSGTAVNGSRVTKHARLTSGDDIVLGDYRLRITLPEAGAAAIDPPRPSPAAAAPASTLSSEVERQDGQTVTEVMALYGRTVLDVQHVDQVHSRRSSAPGLLALGGLLLLAGSTIFGLEVAQDWDAHRTAVQDAAAAGRPAPEAPGHGFGGIGVVLALAGLVPLGLGSIRMRDQGLTEYTIGENPEATFHAPVLGTADGQFPLVRGRQRGGSTLNFTPEMTGEVAVGSQSMTLAELAATGRASRIGESYRYPLPTNARCRVQYGGLTFLVNDVPAGKKIASKSEADKPFWLYNAASLAALGSLLVLTHLVPDDAMAMGTDDRLSQNRFVGFIHQPDQLEEDPADSAEVHDSEDAGGEGQAHAGESGKMGNPTEKAATGKYAMRKIPNVEPQLHRQFNPEAAATRAGILGMIQEDSGHFLASPHGGAFASGVDDEDIWGGLTGTEIGAAYGVGGLGPIGTGRGGGGTGEGTLGLGNVGLIGKSGGGGKGLEYGRGKGPGFSDRGKRGPLVRASKATVRGALDRDIIRRIVRNHINEVRHCYNMGLKDDPNLNGRVAVMFSIGPRGKVASSVVQESSLKDRDVANCVASAVRRWSFPAPDGGGTVMVTYPFVLQPG